MRFLLNAASKRCRQRDFLNKGSRRPGTKNVGASASDVCIVALTPRARCSASVAAEKLVASIRDGSFSQREVLRDIGMSQRRGLLASSEDYSFAISRLGQQQLWQAAVALLEDMPHQSRYHSGISVWNAMMSALEKAGKWEGALWLLETIREHGLQPDVVTFSAAISTFGRGTKWEYTFALLAMMEQREIKPNVVTFNAVVSACERGTQWSQTLGLFAVMWEQVVLPDLITHNAVISACEKGRQWLHALRLLSEAVSRSLQTTVVSYNASISACEKGSQWQWAAQLIDDMCQCGHVPNVISYSASMHACVRGRQWARALWLFSEMHRLGVEVNSVAHSVAISACCEGRQWRSALGLFEGMGSIGSTPDAITYTAALGACQAGSQWRSARALLHRMQSDGISANVISYTTAMSACEHAHQWGQTLDLLSEMRQRRIDPNMISYSVATSACSKEHKWDVALVLLETLRSERIKPSVDVCNHVIGACEKEGRWEWALRVLQEMAILGPDPNAITNRIIRRVPFSLAVQGSLDEPLEPEDLEHDYASRSSQPISQDTSSGQGEPLDAASTSSAKLEDHAKEDGQSHSDTIDSASSTSVGGGVSLSYKVTQGGDAKIDLHGLPVEVAKIAVQVALEDLVLGSMGPGGRGAQEVGDLIIVTGVGKHSPGGIAMIRPAIISFIRDHLRIAVLETRRDGPGRLRIPAGELRRLRGVPPPARSPDSGSSSAQTQDAR